MHYENKSMTIGYILAISGGIFWAVGGACAQLLFQACHITSNWIVPVRLMLAGTILVVFSALRGKDVLSIWKNKQDIKELFIFGLLGSAMCQYSYYTSIEYSNVALATVLSYMSPIPILLYMLFKEKRLPQFAPDCWHTDFSCQRKAGDEGGDTTAHHRYGFLGES